MRHPFDLAYFLPEEDGNFFEQGLQVEAYFESVYDFVKRGVSSTMLCRQSETDLDAIPTKETLRDSDGNKMIIASTRPSEPKPLQLSKIYDPLNNCYNHALDRYTSTIAVPGRATFTKGPNPSLRLALPPATTYPIWRPGMDSYGWRERQCTSRKQGILSRWWCPAGIPRGIGTGWMRMDYGHIRISYSPFQEEIH
jgi:hypothetical protein